MSVAIRTFIAGIIVPGLGYWIIGERKLGVATGILFSASILIFSWTRLVLDPIGLRVLLIILLATLVGGALHAAIVESRSAEIHRSWKSALFFAVAFVITLLLLLSNRGMILGYETYKLPTQSMSPTLLRGDYIIVDTWRYRDEEPANGDIVVFKAPQSGINFIKRIAGLAGDSISLQGNQLSRNGQIVSEPYAVYEGSGGAFQPVPELTIPPNQYFLLGDNRNKSADSRQFGFVPRENIIGRIAHIYYSSDDEVGIRWSRFPTEF